MSLITLPIESQAFEIIRDQIAIILASEIDNQGVLTYDSRLLGMKIFVEAINPEDKADLPVVNVSFVKGLYGDLKVYDGTNKGVYSYNIDVYVNAKETSSSRGDQLSALALQRILAVCRVVLDHPIYKTLAFGAGFIFRTKCNEILIKDEGKNDALNSRMGRITLEVHAQESTLFPTGILVAESNTVVKLNTTSDGYYYSVT